MSTLLVLSVTLNLLSILSPMIQTILLSDSSIMIFSFAAKEIFSSTK